MAFFYIFTIKTTYMSIKIYILCHKHFRENCNFFRIQAAVTVQYSSFFYPDFSALTTKFFLLFFCHCLVDCLNSTQSRSEVVCKIFLYTVLDSDSNSSGTNCIFVYHIPNTIAGHINISIMYPACTREKPVLKDRPGSAYCPL